MAVKELLKKGILGETYSQKEAYEMMNEILEGKVTEVQLSSLLTILRLRGETIEEIVGFSTSILDHTVPLHLEYPQILDTCGTGGDGASTFNISTASSLLLASTGIKVAKHGNSAVTSKSGSADVLQQLGIGSSGDASEIAENLEKFSLCFLFAPNYHPALRHASQTRKGLSFRTVFNILGPLCNPAHPTHQLIGAFNKETAKKMAHAIADFKEQRTLVVTGADGLDECSIFAPTHFFEVENGNVNEFTLTPEDAGLPCGTLEEVTVASSQESAALIKAVLSGKASASAQNIVIYNTAASLYLTGRASTIHEGVKLARDIITTGKASRHLEMIQNQTGGLPYAATNS
ncbi:anthranilate phosphoribosyltransferase [Fictibacillus sp. KIGAM418]|uniref:Anthranilate phosphoribosyltransferase n=1 Tax=Fictibacillus marinisediminis TaxID=2878389 RepID=A0A9X1XB69_9BACL|nr:anthranilate phosphoribosyltransferase [Fictibacillus marinisediminis]MCK6257511.1 anthranilate phosphoribosyltransferase [Fictibacillus marinisediminis]